MNSHFNADLLKIARQSRGLSQSALAEKSGVSQAHISKWENALVQPIESSFAKIATALDFPISFFYETDRVFGLPVSFHPAYRKRASVGKQGIERLEAEMNIHLFHFRRLLRSVDLTAEIPFPQIEVEDSEGGVESVADLVRRIWLVPTGPIRNLTSYAERSGCLVIPSDFGGEAVDGLTIRTPDLPPCIFINRNQPADRQRFTLAHEIGHLVMHRLPSRDMENEANTFAAQLLMPAEDIRPSLSGELTIQKLAAMKPIWRVSMAAILFRSKAMRLLTENQSQYLWRQMSQYGYRRREPAELDFAPETPSVVSELFRAHLEDLGYDVMDMKSMLHTSTDDLWRLYGIRNEQSNGHLRLVT